MKEVLVRVNDYFESLAEILEGKKAVSSVFPNSSDKGTSRENNLLKILSEHLPKRCEISKGGFIFDAEGNESRQIDLLITNDLTLQFRDEGKSFSTIEGCYAAISVKSMLDKQGLYDSLANLASIPQMPNMVNNINWMLEKGHIDEFHDLPLKVIFAYDGIYLSTIEKHVHEFYSNNPVPSNRYPDMIIVNKKYMRLYTGTFTINGYPKGAWVNLDNRDNIGAESLLLLLTRLQYVANFNSHVVFTFGSYFDAIQKAKKANK